eukprot:361927-Chlamydomonas_euryale.AAC.10
MSNKNPVVASDSQPFAIRAPSTEGSVYEPSTAAMTCHIGLVWSQACGGLSASRQQCGRYTHTHEQVHAGSSCMHTAVHAGSACCLAYAAAAAVCLHSATDSPCCEWKCRLTY